MTTQLCTEAVETLKANGSNNWAASVTKILAQIKRYQERARKYIDDNYVEFMQNNATSDLYFEEGEQLVLETEHLLLNAAEDAHNALRESNQELITCMDEFREMSLGLRLTHRILKIDDLFQCVEEANSTKEYLIVLDLLSKLKNLIYKEGGDEVDRLFVKCECYDTVKVKYHIQENILKQNLQQRFEHLVQFTEKLFPHAKCVTLQISKDVEQLQDTVMALFQARYNPTKICDFLMDNCLEPLIIKPVSLECTNENSEYVHLTLSYSLKDLGSSLRPSYKQVFEHIGVLLHCLDSINVSVSPKQHVLTIIGEQIKDRLLTVLVNECLMHAIPETMDELRDSTLVEDVLQFEHLLADSFLINVDTDRALTEFTEQFETYFQERFSSKLLKTAKEIMEKSLQEMTLVATENGSENVSNNAFVFPRCMISKSTLELVKMLERILRQPQDNVNDIREFSFLNIISVILNSYACQVPQLHEKLLESIPQQSALFHNNCMFLAHWVAKNACSGIPDCQTLVKTLHFEGVKYFNAQVAYQQKLLTGILRDFDPTVDTHSLGMIPLKLIRQCLRQLDLLHNVWQSVLSDNLYNKTFCELINNFCADIIKRIMSMEDISASVANELGELIGVILEKAPLLFKEKHDVVHVKCWMKLEQLKVILNASLQEITDLWCEGAGILTVNFKSEEIKHLIRALFQNTDRRSQALSKIV